MWDPKCLAAAICFLTSNVLFVVHGALEMKEESNANGGNTNQYFNYESWKDLDPSYIEIRWVQHVAQRPIMMCAALFGAMAWFWLMVPIIQSAWVLSRGGKRLVGAHMLLAALAACGSIIELLSRLMIVGMTNTAEWLAKDFNLDDWNSQGDGTGWRVLEMIHIVTRGMLLWIDAFEALALFGIVVVMFYSISSEPKFRTKRTAASQSIVVNSESEDVGADAASGSAASTSTSGVVGDTELSGTVYRSDSKPSSTPPPSAFAAVSSKVAVKPTFTKCFAYYGLFVGLLALVDFVADVLRFINWPLFGRIAMATNILLGVVFLPIWLLCLARQLPVATERFEREGKRDATILDAGEDEMAKLLGNERQIS